jgi:hypothetical protein
VSAVTKYGTVFAVDCKFRPDSLLVNRQIFMASRLRYDVAPLPWLMPNFQSPLVQGFEIKD